MSCFICDSQKLRKFMSLGHQPPSDAFLKVEDLDKPEHTYPLDVFFCERCCLVQLNYAVNPELLFRDYVYTSGTNNSLIADFAQLIEIIVNRFKLTNTDLAVDIGSNDGTLLENYLSHGIKILGIDPSSATSFAIKKGLPTIVDFFNEEVAVRVKKDYGLAKIITATNVFAHVNNLKSFMRGVAELLTNDGVFISESHYLLDLITKLQYDSIYHEHLRYYSLRPLQYLFNEYGMEIIDAERITTHGGSIRVYAAKKRNYLVSEAVKRLIQEEEHNGLYQLETFKKYAEKVTHNKFTLMKFVVGLKEAGKSIVGIGAPAKGNTLLNYCRLDGDIIDYIVEKSSLKIGAFTPGTHIPIVSENCLFQKQPDYGLLLSWNIADELIPKLKQQGFRGKFIIPNPIPHIV